MTMKNWNPSTLLIGLLNSASSLESNLAVAQNVKAELPCDSAITLLSTYLRDLKTYAYIKTCTGMFIKTSFITAKK